MTAAAADGPRRRVGIAARLDRLSDGRFAAVMASPGLLLVLLFVVPPIAMSVGMSFFRIELTKDSFTPFVGLRNFVVRLPADNEFLNTLPLTVAFATITTAFAVPLALLAATTINRLKHFRGTLGLLLILPWAVAPIADGLLWVLLLSPGDGIVSKILEALHLPDVLVAKPLGLLVGMGLAVTWRAIPLLGVLLLGALRHVPIDLERSARLDGATRLQVFRHITLPGIRPTLIAAALLQVILTLETFDIQFAMSADSPPKGSLLAGESIFHVVIDQIALGYGAAQTLALAAFIGFVLWLLWLLVVRPTRERLAAATDDLVVAPARRWRIPAARPTAGATQPTAAAPEPRAAAPEPRAAATEPTAAADQYEAWPGRGAAPIDRALGMVRRAGVRLIETVGLAALVTFLAGPFLWLLLASVQSDIFLRMDPPKLGPWLFNGFVDQLTSKSWQAASLVSITVTLGATALSLLIAALTAYPLARFAIRGSRLLVMALIGTQLIPPIALAIPILYIFIRLDLRNTVPGLILINTAFWAPILTFLVRGAFLAVPRNLDLAARIDGASRVGVVLRVMVPAAAPPIIAAAAIVFVGIWNDFVFAAMIGGRDTYTLPRSLGESVAPTLHTLADRIILVILPCIAIIALFRRRIVGLL